MKPSIQTVGQILYSPSQYVIPVFQRNYRWERPHWTKLWESLEEIQKPDKQSNHFMGFLVFVPGLPQPGQHTTFHIIDGQQRLATASILLAGIRNVAREKGQQDLVDEIHGDYLVHPRKRGDQHYRLLPKERDQENYLAIVSGQGEPTGRMADALAYFEEKLTVTADSTPDVLRRIFNTACQRLEFMCATLEAENAYSIFKSLNSTGIPLGPSDLIRNFVFMHVPPDDHDEFDRALWSPLEDRFARPDGTLDEDRFSRFFRDFLMSSGGYVQPKETFPSFETRYEATGFSPSQLARTLGESSEHYSVITSAAVDRSELVTTALSGLNVLESSTTYPLLLALFRERAAGTMNDEALAQAVQMIRGFILRRFVCGESSRGYGQLFARALAKNDGDPLRTLEKYLLQRGWPDDQKFQSAFAEFPLYQRGYTKEVLETLERAGGHREPADLRDASVEHVMPQTLNEEWREALGADAELVQATWLHRPGNLTLSAYNRELWNYDFATKCERYLQSNIGLTRQLADFDRWGEAEILARGRTLAQQAARIWIGPVEPPAPDAPDEEAGPGRHELRRRFWAGLNDYLVAEYPDLPDFDGRPTSTIRLPSGIRHIGVELRLGLRPATGGIDLWFWREASFPLWEAIRSSPNAYNEIVDVAWTFVPVEGRQRASMSIDRSLDDLRNETSWSDLYEWFGEKLTLVYERVAPRLREELDRLGTDPTPKGHGSTGVRS